MPKAHPDAPTLALQAIVWILSDLDRADRLIATTGLTPDGMRARIAEPAVQAAAIGFLCAHEPDLVACAEALGVEPSTLAQAGEALA